MGRRRLVSFKHYLSQTKSDHIVFGRDANEFRDNRYVELLQLEKIKTDSLANETIILDHAGAYKNPQTKIEDFFRFGRHHNIQEMYLAYYAEDILPAVRENCLRIYITIKNPDNFFEI